MNVNQNQMVIEIKNKNLSATFNALGAELISLKKGDKEYIWEGNPEFWNKHSPVLFPIVGTLKENTYFLEGKAYQLPRHGFAREKEFQIVAHSKSKIVFSLKNDLETFKAYPFQFELQLIYELIDSRLEIHYKVENSSVGKMYFSIGGHPGFLLSRNFEEYSLVFESEKQLEFSLLESQLLTKKTQLLATENNCLSLNYHLFKKDALVFKNQQIKSVTVQENKRDFIKVSFKGFPDLGIWTKKMLLSFVLNPGLDMRI